MNKFSNILDNIFVIEQEKIPGMGEDSYCYGAREESAFIAVFDGSGGMGLKKYKELDDHTGAYIASRTISGAMMDWFIKNNSKNFSTSKELVDSIDDYFLNAYTSIIQYSKSNGRISGSLLRDFPTTAAIAITRYSKESIILNAIWAGDSRIYLINSKGLAQVSEDDVRNTDAFINLSDDGAMTNVLSSDGKYLLHCKEIIIDEPTIVITASDGCFGYIPSPMEYEFLLLDNLVSSKNLLEYEKRLKKEICEVAADDISFGFMSFYMETFNELKNFVRKRRDFLKNAYIEKIKKNENIRADLWSEYKENYERYFSR